MARDEGEAVPAVEGEAPTNAQTASAATVSSPAEAAAATTSPPGSGTSNCDGVFRPLDPASPRADRVAWWILTSILAAAVLPFAALALAFNWFGFLVGALILAGAAGVTALSVWLTLTWPAIEYRHVRWAVGAVGIEIRRGVFWKQVITVARSRVQHIDVLQGPLQRRYGLATLTIHTAGTQHASVSIMGLAHAVALEIRDHLLHGGERDGV